MKYFLIHGPASRSRVAALCKFMVTGAFTLCASNLAFAAVPTPPKAPPAGGQDIVSGQQAVSQPPVLDREVTRRPLADSFTPPVLTDSAAAGAQFQLRTLKVQGISVLPRDKVEAIIAPYRGRTVSLADLQKAANAITRLYADRGYGLSFAVVPEQDIDPADPVARIVAIEVYIDRVTVEMNQTAASLVGRKRMEEMLRKSADALRQEHPVRVADIEHMLLSINDLPGLHVTATIRRGVRGQGAAQMVLSITSQGAAAEIQADNRLKSDFGRYEYSLAAKLRSLALVGDELSGTVVRSQTPHDFDFWNIGYQTPILGASTTAFISYAKTSNTASRGELGLLQNSGTEDTLSFGLIQPLIRTRSQSLTARISGGAVDATSSFYKELVSSNKIRTVDLDLAYDLADPWRGLDQAGVTLEQGLPTLGAIASHTFYLTPADATPQYLLTRLRLGRSQSVFGFNLSESADAQIVLYGIPPAPADCTYGGPDLGKGYDAAAFSGEQCVRASTSLSRTFSFGRGISVTPKAFVDGAVLGRLGAYNRPNTGATRTSSVESGGLGMVVGLPFNVALDTVVTVPFGKDVDQVKTRTPSVWFNLDVRQ